MTSPGAQRNDQGQCSQRTAYNFPTETLECDTTAAISRVTQYAKELIRQSRPGGKDPTDREINETAANHGLRTAFSKDGQPVEIATNYLPLTITEQPLRLWVYHVHPVHTDLNGNKVLLKNRACKRDLFNQLATHEATLQQNSGYFASDVNTIWSVRPLFCSPQGVSLCPYTVTSETLKTPLLARDISGTPLHIDHIRITEKQGGLDLSRSVAQLFCNSTSQATTEEDEDSAILARGLNCILTKFARDQSGQCVSTSANKFFGKGSGRTLDFYRHNVTLHKTVQALDGFFASLRPSMDRLLVNINSATTPFFEEEMTIQQYADRVLEHLRLDRPNSGLQDLPGNERRILESILRGVQVRIRLDKPVPNSFTSAAARVRTVTSFGKAIDSQDMRPDIPQKVLQYYSDQSNAVQPLNPQMRRNEISVNVGKPPRGNGRFAVEYYPASQLEIVDLQPVHGQLRAKQTENMIKFARKSPEDNAWRIIDKGLKMFGFNDPEAIEGLSKFKLSVGCSLVKVPARFLNPPTVVYKGASAAADVRDAAWNLRSSAFVVSTTIKKAPLIELQSHGGQGANQGVAWRGGNGFAGAMIEALTKHGLAAFQRTPVLPYLGQCIVQYRDEQSFESQVHEDLRRLQTQTEAKDADLYFVKLLNKDQDLYATVKRVGDIRLGMKTVCVTGDNVGKITRNGRDFSNPNQQYCSNVAMKCNLKGMGHNHHIGNSAFSKLFTGSECDTIVIGADVAHPLKTANPGCPSIASVVGSVDDNFVHFPGSMRLQFGRREFIDKLWDMVKERLIDWAESRKTKTLPKRVLFYRDGVSESQYEGVRQKEIVQLHRAYKLAQAYLDRSDDYEAATRDDDDEFKPPPAKNNTKNDGSAGKVGDVAKGIGKLTLGSTEQGGQKETKPKKEQPTSMTKAEAAEALRKIKDDFQLTYVVVGKRHNTRFYPTAPDQTFGRGPSGPNGNVRPGLLVDQVITHPYSFDFYLQSHQPLTGTGRSAHYFVLTNQMQLSASDLQSIVSHPSLPPPPLFPLTIPTLQTHAFCYTYAKATRGVSYCAPAYYADRLCDRGRAYLRHWLLNRGEEYRLERGEREDEDEYKSRVMRRIYDSDYWRPHRAVQKYGCNRRNPWHPNMDNIMFYL